MRFQVQNIEGRRRWVREPIEDRYSAILHFEATHYEVGTVVDIIPAGVPVRPQVLSDREQRQVVDQLRRARELAARQTDLAHELTTQQRDQQRKIDRLTELSAQLIESLDSVKPYVASVARAHFERITGTKLPIAEDCISST